MTLPASSRVDTLEFTRQLLANRLSLPSPAIAIYPQSSDGSLLAVKVDSTTISVYFVVSTPENVVVNYVGKSVDAVVAQLNSNRLPMRAVALSRELRLGTGDLTLGNTSQYFLVPSEYSVYFRVPGNGIIIRTPKYNVKHKSLAQLRALEPYPTSNYLPWYPRISNGSFTHKSQDRVYHFNIPEFDNQTWSLRYGKPFKDVVGASLIPIGNNAYRVPRAPIFWNGENIKLYNGKVLLSNTIIEDIDTINGIIYAVPNTVLSDQTQIDYSYLETSYEYKHININAHLTQNPQLIDKFVLMYAVPSDSSISVSQKRTIFHTVADSMEEAIASIRLDDPNVPMAIIGGYSIRQVLATDRINILDTRVKGGGLIAQAGPTSPVHPHDSPLEISNKNKEIEEVYQEAPNFWDVGNWDGEIYPGAAAILMDIPNELREILSDNELKARASKFVAAGVYPVYAFSDRPLPSIEGKSAQISAVFSEDLNNHGAGLLADNITLPGSTLTGDWPDFDIIIPVYSTEDTSILSVGAETGYYLPYLRSAPSVGIEWQEREVISNSSAINDDKSYTEWRTERRLIAKSLSGGLLYKDYLPFPRSPSIKEYKGINIHAPIRTDHTGEFKSDVASLLMETYYTLSGRSYGASDYLTFDYLDVSDRTQLTLTDQYFGASPAQRFLWSLMETDLAPVLSGALDTLSDSVITSISATYPHLTFYSPSNLSYYSIDTNSSGISPKEAIIDYAMALRWNKLNGRDYTGNANRINSLLSGLVATTTNGFLGSTFSYNGSFVPDTQILPEGLGYSYAEVGQYNSDKDLNELAPAVASMVGLLPLLDPPYVEDYNRTYWFSTTIASPVLDNFLSSLDRFDSSVNGTRTLDGLPVVNSWYVPYNRYGKFAGKVTKDTTKVIDELYKANLELASTYNGYRGIDGNAVTTYFSGLQYMLETVYSGANQTISRGGMLEPEMADLIYSYGWMAKNKTLLNDLGDQLGFQAAPVTVPDTFQGLFHTGLLTLVKGMTTPEGEMYETTLVNLEPGPFEPTTPSRIFDALSVAVGIDTSYVPLAQATFNTIMARYSLSGLFYSDAIRSSHVPESTNKTTAYLSHLYETLYQLESTDAPILEVYPSPGVDTYKSTLYTARVIQGGVRHEIHVYGVARETVLTAPDLPGWEFGASPEISFFTVGSNLPVSLEIELSGEDIVEAELHPNIFQDQCSIVNGKLELSNIAPGTKLAIKVNNSGLKLITVSVDYPKPAIPSSAITYNGSQTKASSGQVLYFPPGVWNIGQLFQIESSATVYLDGGSWLIGSFDIRGTTEITIQGPGVLSGEWSSPAALHPGGAGTQVPDFEVAVLSSMILGYDNRIGGDNQHFANNRVRDITLVKSPFFNLAIGVTNATNLKIISPWWYNCDGTHTSPDISNQDITSVNNCLLITGDDGVGLETNWANFYIRGNLLVNISASAFILSYWGDGPSVWHATHITDNCSWYMTTKYEDVSVITCWVDNPASQYTDGRFNVTIDGLRVEGSHMRSSLISLRNYPYPTSWGPPAPSEGMGQIYNWVIRNVTVETLPDYRSSIKGLNSLNTPHNIAFSNVYIAGTRVSLSNYSTYFDLNQYPYNISFDGTDIPVSAGSGSVGITE